MKSYLDNINEEFEIYLEIDKYKKFEDIFGEGL